MCTLCAGEVSDKCVLCVLERSVCTLGAGEVRVYFVC